MQAAAARRSHVPLFLAILGFGCAALTLLDKLVGLVQQPLVLATLAYACLLGLLAWASGRGISYSGRLHKPGVYAAILLLNVLTGLYIVAWRVSADPTPWLLQRELARGNHLLDSGERDDAILIYREAYRRYPHAFPVLMCMGAYHYQVGAFDKARRYYEEAVDRAPRDQRWRALNDLGQTLWKLGEPQEAIDYYQQARAAGLPQDRLLEWHYRLGWAYFDAKDYEQAIQHYEVVARAGKKYAAASHYNTACARSQQVKQAKDPEERRRLVREAVQELRDAWDATRHTDEVNALRSGILGEGGKPDPDLAPLRKEPEFAALVRELKASLAPGD